MTLKQRKIAAKKKKKKANIGKNKMSKGKTSNVLTIKDLNCSCGNEPRNFYFCNIKLYIAGKYSDYPNVEL